MSSAGKITIRPRRSTAGPSKLPSAQPSATPTPDPEPADAQTDNTPGTPSEPAIDVDGSDADAELVAETPVVPVKRGPGRPRGSRGRGRGRGKGITIKLPGRHHEAAGEDGDASNVEGGAAASPAPDAGGEAEEPVGRGKPFRTVNGVAYIIEGDELQTEDDPKGDTKIDVHGNLLGGREFRAATFRLPNRDPNRMYMLAIDAARTSGFRDSLYYFRRNPKAYKLNATQAEKDYLIAEGKLGGHLKTRSVTLITARSAYKLHGAKMIKDGRWVVDDYYEDQALASITEQGLRAGDPVGELPDPRANAKAAAEAADAEAAQGPRGTGGGMYRAGGATTLFGGSGWGPFSEGPLNAVKKSYYGREGLTEENWMWVAAERTLRANAEWRRLRADGLKAVGGILGDRGTKRRKTEYGQDRLPMGIYEPQTGVVLYRSDTQPTRSRWEALPDEGEKRAVLGGTKVGNGAWALAWVDTVMELPTDDERDPDADKRAELLESVR
ncbi:hypothetical protein PUNSTDRAFT_97061 [Punctularia strigosozonata HHB-11173 SS5]|uniref:uncharacterized protein n=1 Tax=Punctularia strigosozonata (strain HHB-11173) TaxID=741275 RepID=UPI00044186BF|nr:uncharacterized protein PUNSTDRAFT_97061 [Punctularia strigosozonata HHB-11173 SS5]EIN12380.1 hypothetical protein PUNSTDRAFT_97061 [Punctularia strigosozonata HHB-11173 SS5]